jgi:hypothetical protein
VSELLQLLFHWGYCELHGQIGRFADELVEFRVYGSRRIDYGDDELVLGLALSDTLHLHIDVVEAGSTRILTLGAPQDCSGVFLGLAVSACVRLRDDLLNLL